MNWLFEFLKQDADPWAQRMIGHFVGGVAVLLLAATILLGKLAIGKIGSVPFMDSFVSIFFVLCLLSITAIFFVAAYRIISEK